MTNTHATKNDLFGMTCDMYMPRNVIYLHVRPAKSGTDLLAGKRRFCDDVAVTRDSVLQPACLYRETGLTAAKTHYNDITAVDTHYNILIAAEKHYNSLTASKTYDEAFTAAKTH